MPRSPFLAKIILKLINITCSLFFSCRVAGCNDDNVFFELISTYAVIDNDLFEKPNNRGRVNFYIF